MVSTLKLTKIQIPNSDSDVISLDASTGNVTIPKNITVSGTLGGTSIAVQGEGTATTNLQQGLAKCWVECNPTLLSGTGTTGVGDSFNLTSITDDAVGTHTVNINNNMSSIEYATPTAANSAFTYASYGLYSGAYSHAAGSFVLHSRRQNASADSNYFGVAVHGDLA